MASSISWLMSSSMESGCGAEYAVIYEREGEGDTGQADEYADEYLVECPDFIA